MSSLDLNIGNLSTAQTNEQPSPVTIASAATIAPKTFMTVVSGAVAIANIVPPATGAHMLAFIAATGATWTLVATGNIAVASVAPDALTATLLFYDPRSETYYPMLSGALV